MRNKAQIAEIFTNPLNVVSVFTSWPPPVDTEWYAGGPFGKYTAAVAITNFLPLPWATQTDNGPEYLDAEYVWKRSGSKIVSPYLVRGITVDKVPFIYEDSAGVVGVPNHQNAIKAAFNPINRLVPKWRALWDDLETVKSMNRLTNRDYTETRTGKETIVTDYGKVSTDSGSDVNTKEQTDSNTETPSGSDMLTIAGKRIDVSTPTGSNTTTRSGKVTDDSAGTTAVYGYGYNTASGLDDPGKKNQRNGSEAHNTKEYTDLKDVQTVGVKTTDEHTYQDYKETRTRGQKTDSSYHSSIQDDTKYGKVNTASGADTVTRTPEFTISHTGIDGKNSVLLLEELFEASDIYDFFNRVVFRDLDHLYTLRVY